MKTAVSQTSLASIWAMRDSGELPQREREIYEALVRNGPMTREQLASITGTKEGSACGRVATLIERGMISHHSTVKNRITGKYNECVWLAPCRVQIYQVEMELIAA
ncbi:MAG: hypothetical protein JWR21_912 [Herminiimonas sp.]|nr:hypothetical protein [Herminiimonas sp.]